MRSTDWDTRICLLKLQEGENETGLNYYIPISKWGKRQEWPFSLISKPMRSLVPNTSTFLLRKQCIIDSVASYYTRPTFHIWSNTHSQFGYLFTFCTWEVFICNYEDFTQWETVGECHSQSTSEVELTQMRQFHIRLWISQLSFFLFGFLFSTICGPLLELQWVCR